MWYVCDVFYLVVYVCVNCFVVPGCAVSRRDIHGCNSYVFSVNMYLDHLKFCFLVSTEFTVVCYCHIDVVSSEARCGIPSELLYVDDLVFTAPIIQPLGRQVIEWRVRFLDKRLKVNARKSTGMVGSSGVEIILNS